jgi:hypothetical protein
MKKVLIPKEALEKFVEIAQDNLDEKRVLRIELQWQVTKLRILHPCHDHATLPGPAALQKLYSLNNRPSRRPAGLQAFLRP